MKLVDQWETVERALPPDWRAVQLTLVTEQASELPRAAQVLGPMSVGRVEGELVLHVLRAGGAQGPEAARRLFARLDESRVWCELTHTRVESGRVPAALLDEPAARSVAASWDAALKPLPPDATDLLGELELTSSDHLDRAALLCAPLNPTRETARLAFVFRCSGGQGYGVSPAMARRCFARLDEEGISGTTRVLRSLSDLDNVATQGAVWLVGGRML